MRKVSEKQKKKNKAVSDIKKSLPNYCCICGAHGVDAAHILPKSMFPEYYTEPWNIIPLCREHHVLFDADRNFRREQTKLIEIVREHDELAANRHFGL